MKLFDVYPINDIEPVKASGSKIWDEKGQEYLDLYGGHAVISVGHSHPYYVKRLTKQIKNLGFYSNSVKISLQDELAEKLGKISGLKDFTLFLANSGAEANENALKLASFHTGRTKIVAFTKSFHGRTSAAVAVTDNPSIKAPINFAGHVQFVPFNDVEATKKAIDNETCAVIVEGIQGVGGIQVATEEFLNTIRAACDKTGAVFIHDSVQCGYGRSGKFFSYQYYKVKPDIISVAKGMGNGFPVGGILISPKFHAKHGLLGTTFGGNHLACVAAISVLDIIKKEKLVENAATVGTYLLEQLSTFKELKDLRGKGLMIGIELDKSVSEIRNKLLFEDHIFTGVAGANTIRLLPSLALTKTDADKFLEAFSKYVK
ncbi:MAG: aspartate aminotransferase family protein [Cytophagaceae bacterium]|nr:aspartate aminotransferase family protein [Cytophagaceae bacterium]